MDVRTLIRTELARRRDRNPRYSLRAFARQLGVYHSTLSLIMDGARLTPRTLGTIGPRLGLTAEEIATAAVEENAVTLERLALVPGFRADSRWLAERSGVPIDEVNVALHHLLYNGRLRMATTDTWTKESAG